MDIYDFLKQNNLIKHEDSILKNQNKIKRDKILNKYKNRIKVKLIEKEDIDIDITTDVEEYNNIKNEKIYSYSYNNEKNKNYNILKYYKLYPNELKDYNYIDDNINDLILGGYIRYINKSGELKFGGILLKVINFPEMNKMKLLIKNRYNIYNINYIKNYVFYKKHTRKNDKFRDIFIKVAKLE